LREEHLAKRRALISADSGVVTIGQASVFVEMKLANDSLRWRLQQKQQVIEAQQKIISGLQNQLKVVLQKEQNED
jgi:hypothetical protein